MTRTRKDWSENEDNKLRTFFDRNMTYEEIAAELGRTDASISRRIQKLKLKRSYKKTAIHLKSWGQSTVKYKRPDDVFKAHGTPVPWTAHKDGCRFPVEPSNLPCNAPCQGVYCEAHSKICRLK